MHMLGTQEEYQYSEASFFISSTTKVSGDGAMEPVIFELVAVRPVPDVL